MAHHWVCPIDNAIDYFLTHSLSWQKCMNSFVLKLLQSPLFLVCEDAHPMSIATVTFCKTFFMLFNLSTSHFFTVNLPTNDNVTAHHHLHPPLPQSPEPRLATAQPPCIPPHPVATPDLLHLCSLLAQLWPSNLQMEELVLSCPITGDTLEGRPSPVKWEKDSQVLGPHIADLAPMIDLDTTSLERWRSVSLSQIRTSIKLTVLYPPTWVPADSGGLPWNVGIPCGIRWNGRNLIFRWIPPDSEWNSNGFHWILNGIPMDSAGFWMEFQWIPLDSEWNSNGFRRILSGIPMDLQLSWMEPFLWVMWCKYRLIRWSF